MPIIIGTGGHVDHGKTALVTALTGHGEDLDRWTEEKKRGLTIDIGFAFMDDGRGGKISFVDVPGHEDFVNNMVVGASGIDIGLLVVAADDAVMPQTVEHLEIMDLLGIHDCVVAITKADIADEETLELVREDIRELFSTHPDMQLHGLLQTSSKEGTGIEELRQFLRALTETIGQSKSLDGLPRLPVDRVFPIKGFGTVVTGSLVSGIIHVGDDLEVSPGGAKAHVRGIEVDDSKCDEALRGQRTALNLAGLERDQIKRGDQVAFPGLVKPVYMLNALINPAVSLREAIENRMTARFMAGTTAVVGKIEILNAAVIEPGGKDYLVQIRLKEAVPVKNGDRFILRRLSPELTIAGGRVLETTDRKITARHREEHLKRLERLKVTTLAQRLEECFRRSRHAFLSAREAALDENCPFDRAEDLIENTIGKALISHANRYLHKENLKLYRHAIGKVLKAYHNANPYDTGAPAVEIRNGLPAWFNDSITDFVVSRMTADGTLQEMDRKYALADFGIKLSNKERELAEDILRHLRTKANRFSPPGQKELAAVFDAGIAFENTWRYLLETGQLTRIEKNIFFPAETLEEIKSLVRARVLKDGSIDVKTLRNELGNSRKYAIAIMEFFDQSGFTRRDGDKRILRE